MFNKIKNKIHNLFKKYGWKAAVGIFFVLSYKRCILIYIASMVHSKNRFIANSTL